MKISRFKLVNFRNYFEADTIFEQGVNLITGTNGQGKTNIVEAIDFLSVGKSFKTTSDSELIHFKEKYARIEVNLQRANDQKEINALITSSGKKITCNGIELKKLSELSGMLLCVIFTPEDVLFFKDSPSVRRRYIDVNLSSLFKEYMNELLKYKNILKERNTLLKENSIDLVYLETLEERLCEPQYKIIKFRQKLVEELNLHVQEIFKELDHSEKKIEIKYFTFSKEKEYALFKNTLMNLYKENRDGDMKRKATSIGIHHDDIKMYMDQKDVGVYASQGQNRICALSLKLSMFNVIKKYTSEDAIVILDDVLSELDEAHQIRLLAKLREFEQVFITCAKENFRVERCTTYVIKENKITRRM